MATLTGSGHLPYTTAWDTIDTRARSLSISRIVCPPSVRLRTLAPLFPKPRARETTSIRLPTANRATIGVMAVNAFAEPRRRTFWKWQWWGTVAQETFITQPLGSWARPGLSDNADRVPRLFEGSRQLRLRHHLRNLLCHSRLLLRYPVCAKSMTGCNWLRPSPSLADSSDWAEQSGRRAYNRPASRLADWSAIIRTFRPHEYPALLAQRRTRNSLFAAKVNAWTPERRARQAAAIHRWKPWQGSTGPKSPEGKAPTARRGFKPALAP
jgi:hypothetical protein